MGRLKCGLRILLAGLLVGTLFAGGCRKPKEKSTLARKQKKTKQEARSKKIVPSENRCYVGFFPGWGEYEDSVNAKQIKDFEKSSGKPVAFAPFSNCWGRNYTSSEQLGEISNYGAIPLLRLLPWGEPYWEGQDYQPEYSLQKIIDGEFDQFLSNWADEIKSYGRPVMVTFGVEMNGDWFTWSGVHQGGGKTKGYGDSNKADGPERYVDAYRHIVMLFKGKGVANATWLFHANSQSYPDKDWNSIEAYYPGDEYVDWIGVSVYGAQYNDEKWDSFDDLMEPAYEELISLSKDKPLMIPEWGVAEWPKLGDKAEWYRDALASLQSKYPRIKIAIVYHEKWENDDGSYSDLRINSSPAALEAYKNGISSDYFIGKYD